MEFYSIWEKAKLSISLIACFAIAIVGFSCNSNNKEKKAEQTTNQAQKKINKTDTVIIAGMKFEPENITVKKGDTILFINNDIVAHNVTEKDSAWQSQVLNPNDKWEYIPDKSYDYFCSLHLVMKGKITVE